MDTSSPITHLGLCAGYGGIELGLHRVIRNLRTVALSEIEAFACANLVAKMEAGLMDCAPIWTDLKTFPWAEFRDRVDILTGGYPCQPFSAAGKRLGTEDPRHLWPFIASGIRILRPKLCYFENVEGHISLGLREVIGELESIGYQSSWGIFSASEVGAPHQRKRVFILAHSECAGLERLDNWDAPTKSPEHERTDTWSSRKRDIWPSRPGEQQFAWEPPRVVGNARGQESCRISSWCGWEEVAEVGESDGQQTQPSLGRDADGPAGGMDYAELCVSCDNRTDELRLLGNGVVPATAERAFLTLWEELFQQQPTN